METARLSSKGQLVLPKSIRERLRLQSGSEFNVEIEGEKIILEPVTGVRDARWRTWQGACKGNGLIAALKAEHQEEIEHDEKSI